MFKNASKYLIASVIVAVSQLLILPVTTRYLSVDDFGALAIFILVGNVFANISSLGLGVARNRFYFSLFDDDFKTLFTAVFLSELTLFAIFGLLAFKIGFVFFHNLFTEQIVLGEDIFFLSLFNGVLQYFFVSYGNFVSVQKRANLFFVGTVITLLVNLSLSLILLVYFDFGLSALILGLLVSNFVGSAIYLIANQNFFSIGQLFNRIKDALAFGLLSCLDQIIGLIQGSFDRGMLLENRGFKDVGLYEFGSKFSLPLKLLMDSFARSWSPFAFETDRSGLDGRRKIEEKFFEMVSLLGFLAISASLFCEELLFIFTTPAFMDSKFIVPILVSAYFWGVGDYIGLFQLQRVYKPIYNSIVTALAVCLNVFLNFLLIPSYGIAGAAIATMIASLISSLIRLYFGQNSTQFYPRLRDIYFSSFWYSLLFYLVIGC